MSTEQIIVPDNVSIKIRSRIVTVEGPRGKLTKDLSHIAVTFVIVRFRPQHHRFHLDMSSQQTNPFASKVTSTDIPHSPNPTKYRSRSTTVAARTSQPSARSSQSFRTSSPASQRATSTRCDTYTPISPSTSTSRRARKMTA